MIEADSVHSTPRVNLSARDHEKRMAKQEAKRQKALQRLQKLRKKAADEIDRLLEFIDAVDDTDVDSQIDDEPIDEDGEAEPSLGFLESHPTIWNGDGRDRSGNQECLCAGLGGDLEEEHDGREPGEDDEPSIGYDVEPAEEDTGNDEPSLGWTEASSHGQGVDGRPTDLEESSPVVTEAARARYRMSDRYATNTDGRHVDSERGFGISSRRIRNLSDGQRKLVRPKIDRTQVSC